MKNGAVISFGVVVLMIGVWLGLSGKLLVLKSSNPYFGVVKDKFCLNKICLTKNGDDYWVETPQQKIPGDSEVIGPYMKKLSELKLTEVISENKSKFADFGVGGSDQLWLTANGKKLEIGGPTGQYDGTMVKPESEEKIYKMEMITDKTNMGRVDYWKQKILMSLPYYQISEVSVTKDGKVRNYQKENVNKLVASLPIVDYLEQTPKGKTTEIVINEESETRKIHLGVDDSNKKQPIYWATIDESKYFSISKENYLALTI